MSVSLVKLRHECGYDPEDGSVDDLIGYKDALEDAYESLRAQAGKDAYAIDCLAEVLRRPTWPSGADFLDFAAVLVRGTGRVIDS